MTRQYRPLEVLATGRIKGTEHGARYTSTYIQNGERRSVSYPVVWPRWGRFARGGKLHAISDTSIHWNPANPEAPKPLVVANTGCGWFGWVIPGQPPAPRRIAFAEDPGLVRDVCGRCISRMIQRELAAILDLPFRPVLIGDLVKQLALPGQTGGA